MPTRKAPLIKRERSRKPNAEDKRLADLVRSLPLGKHMLRVDDYDLGKSPIKMENTTHFRVDSGWASLIVNGADSWTKAKLGGYDTMDLEAVDVGKVKKISGY